jgi:hypothetical protein
MTTGTGDLRRLWLLLVALSAGLLLYSQSAILDWDEGFHLVAASLVAAGKRPYIDFCFPQPPMHAWWNAFWLNSTGGGWRGPQAIAALLSCGAIGLTADFVYRRAGAFPACVAALFVGLNSIVVEFGTKAQAYGACMFLTVAAFRLIVGVPGWLGAVVGGCVAGAAAGCSLLAAPAIPVLLVWQCWRRQWTRAIAFLLAVAVPLAPVLISFVQAPFQTWFNLVEYHTLYRRVGWTEAAQNDWHVLTSWVDSGPALLLGIFTVAALWFGHRDRPAPGTYLAIGMATGLAAEAAVAHPTFPQYFVFVVPFLAIPAALGFRDVIDRLTIKPALALSGIVLVLLLSLTNSLVSIAADNQTWTSITAIARRVEEVTPPGGNVMADPPVYFAMHRLPPTGMEFPATFALDLPGDVSDKLHIIPHSALVRRVRAGEFATVETCKGDEDEILSLDLPSLYSHSATVSGCAIYWGLK